MIKRQHHLLNDLGFHSLQRYHIANQTCVSLNAAVWLCKEIAHCQLAHEQMPGKVVKWWAMYFNGFIGCVFLKSSPSTYYVQNVATKFGFYSIQSKFKFLCLSISQRFMVMCIHRLWVSPMAYIQKKLEEVCIFFAMIRDFIFYHFLPDWKWMTS